MRFSGSPLARRFDPTRLFDANISRSFSRYWLIVSGLGSSGERRRTRKFENKIPTTMVGTCCFYDIVYHVSGLGSSNIIMMFCNVKSYRTI